MTGYMMEKAIVRSSKTGFGSLRRMAGVTAVALLALSGCVNIGTKPPEQLLRLTPSAVASAGVTSSGQVADAFVVLDPEADRGLDVLRVPVTVDAASLAYLKDATWVEKPSRQFRALLAETLRTQTSRLVLEGGDFEVSGRTLISGRLLQMGYDAQKKAVVVRFEAVQTERGGGPIQSRRFEAVVNGVEAKAQPVGVALNQAANDVAQQVVEWVKG